VSAPTRPGVRRGRAAALLLTVLLALLGACSPEAVRQRGGGPGGDVGNHGSPIEIHGRTDPSHQTPRVGQAIRT
jgi:hypothetical protein